MYYRMLENIFVKYETFNILVQPAGGARPIQADPNNHNKKRKLSANGKCFDGNKNGDVWVLI